MLTTNEPEPQATAAIPRPLSEPVIVRETDVSWSDTGRHRPPGRKGKVFGFFDMQSGVTIRASLSFTNSSRYTPRHKHTFDQVRYIVSGKVKLGRRIYGAGDCLYFPEGVFYGPEDASVCDERIGILMQFPGPSKMPYPHPYDAERARRELAGIGKFDGGVFVWPNGRKLDGQEACTEYLNGGKVTYPAPRYPELIAMHTENYPWEPLEGAPGISVRHLGYFNEVGPNIKLVKIAPGATTPRGTAICQQVRYLLEGEVLVDGAHYPAISCMYFPAGVPYPAVTSPGGATLLVVQLASPSGKVPPFCLI